MPAFNNERKVHCMSAFSGVRVVSALVLTAFLFLAVFFGGWVATALAFAFCLLIFIDSLHALRSAGYKPFTLILAVFFALLVPAYYFFLSEGAFLLYGLTVVVLLCAGVFRREGKFTDLVFSLFLLMYPLLPIAMLLFLTMLPNIMLSRLMLTITVVVPSMCDIFAYYIGVAFGRRKLCPAISPKKTIAGALGAFAGGLFGGAAIGLVVLNFFPQVDVTIGHFLLLGFLTAFFTQLGDLSASMFKRFCQIKDFGTYIPGHGGALDRLDGVLVTAVLMFVYTQLILLR